VNSARPFSVRRLSFDGDAFPKRDVVFDVGGGVFGLRVEPGGVLVALAIDDELGSNNASSMRPGGK